MYHVYLNRLFFGDEVKVLRLKMDVGGFLLLPTREQMIMSIGRHARGMEPDPRVVITLDSAHLVSFNHPGSHGAVFKMPSPGGGRKDQGEFWMMKDLLNLHELRVVGFDIEAHSNEWSVACK